MLVLEKLVVEWDLAWPSSLSPKAEFKGGRYERHLFLSRAEAIKEGFFFFLKITPKRSKCRTGVKWCVVLWPA